MDISTNAIDTFVYVYEGALQETVQGGAVALGDQVDVDGLALHDAVLSAVNGLSGGLKSVDGFVQAPSLDKGINTTNEILDIVDDNKESPGLVISSVAKVFGCA